MRILILGATGGIGSAFCRLAQGHELIALARAPERVPAGVSAVKGDPLRAADIRAIACDAIVCALGPRPGDHTSVLQTAMAAILAAPVQRVVAVSAGMLFPGVITAIVRMFLREHVADLRAMEAALTASEKDWTIVRPPRLTDAPGRDGYRTSLTGCPSTAMARADVARALVDIVSQQPFSRQIVGLGAP